MSARTDARDSVLTRLQAAAVTGGALDGYSVEGSRVDPVDDSDEDAPAPQVILVFGDARDGETKQTGYRTRFVSADTARIKVVALCSAGTGAGLEASMDAAESGIDDTLLADQSWLDLFRQHPTVRMRCAVDTMASGRLRGAVIYEIDCPMPAREVV